MLILNEHYSISTDPFNVILRYEKIGEVNEKTGKPTVTKRETYHNTVEQAAESYLNQRLTEEISAPLDMAISALLDKITEIKNEIIAKVKKV